MSHRRAVYAPELEAADDWQERQDRIASRAVRYAGERAPEVRARLERAGVDPETIVGVEDLERIPVLPKDALPDLQAVSPPFGGMLAVPLEKLDRIFTSPGPILDPQGRTEDSWGMAPALWAAGFRPGQVVINTFSYHLTPGGLMMDAALRALGATVIPGGVGNTAAQVEIATIAGATGYVGTPQFLLTFLEAAIELGSGLRLERATVTGGPFPHPLKRTIEADHGVQAFECYGTADAGCLGYECGYGAGWHVAPGVVIEITDPATGRPVAPGETGEVVVTKEDETYPLVRFGTGDLSALLVMDGETGSESSRCLCGRTSPRLKGFLGRTGEGVKVKGMFVHPRQLDRAFSGHKGVARYQAVVTAAGHSDLLTIRVEPGPGVKLAESTMMRDLKNAVNLRLSLEVVAPGTIPDGAPKVLDLRDDPV